MWWAFELMGGLVGAVLGVVLGGAVRGAATLVRLVIAWRHLGSTIRCREGCPPQPADGWWSCGKCGARFRGWVWDPCYVCSARAGWTPCRHCGHAIRSEVL